MVLCTSTNIRIMYQSYRTDLLLLPLATPAKHSFHGPTGLTPTRSGRSVKNIFAAVFEVIVIYDSVAPPFRYLVVMSNTVICRSTEQHVAIRSGVDFMQ
jgi:hypothetical protein